MDLVKLMDLGIGKCRVCVGMRNEDSLDLNAPEITIATKMVNITRSYFASKAMASSDQTLWLD